MRVNASRAAHATLSALLRACWATPIERHPSPQQTFVCSEGTKHLYMVGTSFGFYSKCTDRCARNQDKGEATSPAEIQVPIAQNSTTL